MKKLYERVRYNICYNADCKYKQQLSKTIRSKFYYDVQDPIFTQIGANIWNPYLNQTIDKILKEPFNEKSS